MTNNIDAKRVFWCKIQGKARRSHRGRNICRTPDLFRMLLRQARFLRCAAIFIASWFVCIIPARTQPAEERQVTVSLFANPSQNTAWGSIDAVGVRPPDSDPKRSEEIIKRALTAAFGAPVNALEYHIYDEADSGEEGDEPPAKPMPQSPTENKPLGWSAETFSYGPHARKVPIFPRRGTLQEGRIDPAPLAALLRPLGVETMAIRVTLQSGGAPVAECIGADPVNRYSYGAGSLRRSRNASTMFVTKRSTATPGQIITFAAGYRSSDVGRIVAPLVALLLLPILLTVCLSAWAVAAQRRAADNLDEETRRKSVESIAFGCFRYFNTGAVLFSLLWTGVSTALNPAILLLWYCGVTSGEVRAAVNILSFALPPALIAMLGALLLRPVFARVTGGQMTIGETLLQSGGAFALFILPVLFIFVGVSAFLDNHFLMLGPLLFRTPAALSWILIRNPGAFRFLGWFALAMVSTVLIAMFLNLGDKTPPAAITHGELKDRVMALAAKAGVALKQILYIGTGRSRLANAFAANGNIVAFTDRLLGEMSRAEVDGITAHELAHLKRRHGQKKQQLHLILTAFPVIAILALSRSEVVSREMRPYLLMIVLPLMIGVTLLIEMAASRKYEREADSDAVKLTGDPAGLITGLARLQRLSGLPSEWGRWNERLLTHPSTRRRIAALAAEGALTQEAVDALLARQDIDKTPPAEERYPLPIPLREETLFTPARRLRFATATNLALLFLFVAVTLLTALAAERWFPRNAFLALLTYVVGGVFTYLTSQVLFGFRALRIYQALYAPLREKLIGEGVLPDDPNVAAYVGIAPAGPPRLFEGSPDGDLGFLVFEPERLRVVGEQTRLSLDRTQIKEIRYSRVRGAGLVPPRIAVLWNDPETGTPTERTTFTLRPVIGKNGFALRRNTAALRQQLKQWRERETLAPTDPDDAFEIAPLFSLPGGLLVRDVTRPKTIWIAMRPLLLLVLAAGLLSTLPLRAPLGMALTLLCIYGADWIRLYRIRNIEP